MTGATSAFGGRSETIRGLRGDGSDERFRAIELEAGAISGWIVTSAVVIAFIVQLARGDDGSPYGWLAAIAGVSYVSAIVYLRRRR